MLRTRCEVITMIVCSEEFFERLEKGELSVIERERYKICQTAQTAMEDMPVFYIARPQGVKAPAVFVRIAKMVYHKRLAKEMECAVLFEVRYLAEKPYDDSECEQAMEKLMDAFGGDGFDKQTVSAERADDGALIKVASKLRWKLLPKEQKGDIMQSLVGQLEKE